MKNPLYLHYYIYIIGYIIKPTAGVDTTYSSKHLFVMPVSLGIEKNQF